VKPRDKQFNVRLPESVHRELKARCVMDGISLSAVIEELALAYLDGEIKVPKR
jgi:predicted HicB family RNase H-like nuclease